MEKTFHEVYYDVEKAIDFAFQGKFVLKFYDYLKVKGAVKREVDEFIKSTTVTNINEVVLELDNYLEGGADNQHKQLREAYGHLQNHKQEKYETICMVF
jgi:hypothetical protein